MAFRHRRYSASAFASVHVSFYHDSLHSKSNRSTYWPVESWLTFNLNGCYSHPLETRPDCYSTNSKSLAQSNWRTCFLTSPSLHALVLPKTKHFLEPVELSLPEKNIPLEELIKLIAQQTKDHLILSDEVHQTQTIHLSPPYPCEKHLMNSQTYPTFLYLLYKKHRACLSRLRVKKRCVFSLQHQMNLSVLPFIVLTRLAPMA